MQVASRNQVLNNEMDALWTTLELDNASAGHGFSSDVPEFLSSDFLTFPELNFTAPGTSPSSATPELRRFRQLAPPSVWCTSISEYLEAMESSLNAYVQFLGGKASENVYDNPTDTRPSF